KKGRDGTTIEMPQECESRLNPPEAVNDPETEAADAGGDVAGADAELRERLLANDRLKLLRPCQKTDITSGAAKETLIRLMVAVVENAQINLPITAFKCDHDPGTLHERGLAIDIGYFAGSAEGNELYKFLYANRTKFKIDELIFNPPAPGTQCVGGGKTVNCVGYYGSDTMAAHGNHIHVGTFP
ncbi:MAG TPA: hypothetical protein VF272_04295, partial [Candidatus Saccharimonadia bacterium]